MKKEKTLKEMIEAAGLAEALSALGEAIQAQGGAVICMAMLPPTESADADGYFFMDGTMEIQVANVVNAMGASEDATSIINAAHAGHHLLVHRRAHPDDQTHPAAIYLNAVAGLVGVKPLIVQGAPPHRGHFPLTGKGGEA